jgi:hypothetical protein
LIFESAVIQIVNKTSEGFVGEICFHEANKQVSNSFAPSNLWKATVINRRNVADQLVTLNLVFWHAGLAFDTLSFIAVVK